MSPACGIVLQQVEKYSRAPTAEPSALLLDKVGEARIVPAILSNGAKQSLEAVRLMSPVGDNVGNTS
jgi:hypothetical protein